MPRKKQNMRRVRKEITEEEKHETPEIKTEPADDYDQSLENSELISMDVKSETIEDEYLNNSFNENLSENNQEVMNSSALDSSINQNDVSMPTDQQMSDQNDEHMGGGLATRRSERNAQGKHWYDQYEKYSIDELITMFGRNDRPYKNMTISEEEYLKYTGKQLEYPITKKMYEHFRYMKTKILYKDKFKCDLCTRTFPFRHELARHRLYHTGIKKHVCEVCGKTFILKGQLTTHMLSHTRIRRFKCKYCPASFLLGSHLRQHLPSHNPALRLQCELCNLTFTRKASLDRHVRRIHIEKEKEMDILQTLQSKRQNKNFTNCHFCNRLLRSKDVDKCSCRSKIRRDYCPICNTRLGNAKNLTIHMETFHPDALNPLQKPASETDLDVANENQDVNDENDSSNISDKGPPPGITKKLLQDKILGRSGVNKRKPAWTTQIKPKPAQVPVINSNPADTQKTMPILSPIFNTTLVPVQVLLNQGLTPGLQGPTPGLPLPGNQSNIILAPPQGFDGKTFIPITGLKPIQINPQVCHKNGTFITPAPGIDVNPSPTVPKKNKIQILPKLPFKSHPREVRVGSANGRYNVMCIEPRENDVKRKEEMDRVVTFKVETNDDNQGENAYGQMVADIKVEPEDGEEPDRFVVYKVTEDEPSIRDGFYKALCIKQEVKEEPPDDGYYGYTSTCQQREGNHDSQISNGHVSENSHGSYENGIMGDESHLTEESDAVESPEWTHEMGSESQTDNGYQYILDCDEIEDSSQDSKLSQDSNSNMTTLSSADAMDESNAKDVDVQSDVSNSNYTTLKLMLESQT